MGDVIVSMEHITKEFPGVKALDDVKFNLRAGEVMALLGENGAGKSTLMKILSGVYSLDQGSLKIFGKDYSSLTPSSAREAGVAIIHQELNMCKDLTVAQNMFLGREERKGFVLNNSNMEDIARKYLGELGVDISPDEIVGELPVSKQQMIEIAKALSINAKILIMDEPTSALTSREIDELFNIIRKLKSQGCGIVYISHRLEELAHITDRVTIMRDGHYITEGNFTDFTMDEIIANMVGREIKEKFPHVECKRGKKVFEVKNLNAGRLVRDINFSLYEGEIVGFAGLMGAGRTETTRAIFGVDPKESGTLILDGKEITINNPMDAIKAGVVLAPEDRKKDGLCTKLSIRHNIALPNLDLICGKGGVINTKIEEELCDKAVADLLKIAEKPFIATHSNCRSVCSAERNLTDRFICEIVDRRGLIGLNYLIYFLRQDDPAKADMEDVARHIDYLLNLGAEDVIALGSDFDGAKVPSSFDSLEKLNGLYAYLASHFGQNLTDKLFYENGRAFFLRNFK